MFLVPDEMLRRHAMMKHKSHAKGDEKDKRKESTNPEQYHTDTTATSCFFVFVPLEIKLP